jgi:hypothetical protein
VYFAVVTATGALRLAEMRNLAKAAIRGKSQRSR